MSAANTYENERILAEYLLFHFGEAGQILPWAAGPHAALGFPARIVERFSGDRCRRGLDLGCAVGRSAFEMSRTCGEVVAIDFSSAFIASAKRIQAEGRLTIQRRKEGAIGEPVTVALPDGCMAKGVQFEQGDAMALRDDLGDFDRVLAANLLCRLTDPQRLLDRLPSLVRPGGELILTTPCTWLEEFTPRDHWPSGTTFAWLGEKLGPDFELLEEHDEPFLIREHARKFQWSVALLTKWRKR